MQLYINRQQMIAEEILREHVRSRITESFETNKLIEQKIRQAVRQILEAETGTEESSQNTGINVLADVLEKIIPVVQDDYRMLTTSPEQRESFRNHIIHAIKNSLRPIESSNDAEKELPEGYLFDIDIDYLTEKVKIDLSPEGSDAADEVSGEFIDIDAPSEDEGFDTLDDQNETGRNFAAVTFKQIEKQLIDAYDMLADEEDQKLFYDYLITNMLLYFDKFEDELMPSLPDTTTPEYEKALDDEAAETEETPAEDAPAEEAPAGEAPAEEDTGTGMPPGMDDDW